MSILPAASLSLGPARPYMMAAADQVLAVGTLDETGLDAQSWNLLASRGSTNTIYQTFQWHASWLATYGKSYRPLFMVVRSAGSVAGVAALVIEQTGQGRVARFVGDGRADYCDFLTAGDSGSVATIFRGLSDSRDWDVLDLKNIPADSPSIDAIRASSRESGFRVLVRDQFVCPTLLIRGHEASALEILNKPSLRRRESRLQRMGRLTSRDLSSAEEILPLLDAFFDQHIARWSASSTPSLFCDPTNRAFYRELTKQLDGTGWLLFSSIELDDAPIALHYGFDFNDKLIWYKPSFDPAFASRSPGLVLVHHLINRAVEHGRRELDFTVGDEAFKMRFTNATRATVQVQVFRDPARYAYERSKVGVIDAYRRVATLVKSS